MSKSKSDTIRPAKESKTKDVIKRMFRNKSAVIGLIILIIFVIAVALAGVITDKELTTAQDASIRLQPPSKDHPFGTDPYGRDVFARVLFGGRISMSIGLFTAALSLVAGGLLGAVAAYYGGNVDNVIMRVMDMISAIPGTLLALAIVSAIGTSMINLMIAITISSVPAFTRLVRSTVLTVVGSDYVEAARACGTKDLRIILKHILPNAVGPIIVQTTASIASMILLAAGMSFIGMGVQPPTPEWGAMISEAREFLRQCPYLVIFPGVAIVLTALSFNLIGDGLRDALDPRLRD